MATSTIDHRDLMLATPSTLFSAKGWIYELKYDGFRCLIAKRGGAICLASRNGRDMDLCFPELIAQLQPIRHDFLADGELVVLDSEGRPVWERLQRRHRLEEPRRIAQAAATDPAALFVSLCLICCGLMAPTFDRGRCSSARMHRMLPANRRVRYAVHVPDRSADLWQLAVSMDLEGIVATDASSQYVAGRSDRWLKIKTAVGAERESNRRPR